MATLSLDFINENIKQDPAGFVKSEDEKYRSRIETAADMICSRKASSPIVLLAGPSGSGKTTTAKKLEDELKRRGINTHTVSMDDYFQTMDPDTAPRTPEGDLDFESPECLDMELLNEHFTTLSKGGEVHIPYFMFARQKRSASRFTPMRLEKNEIAIFEGIHAFNDAITSVHPEAFRLYICAMSDIETDGKTILKANMTRLIRRVVRDSKFRGADALVTLKMWANVIRGEKIHIYPYIDSANFSINSSLGYEIPLLKDFAFPLFENLPKTGNHAPEEDEVLSALRLFASLNENFADSHSLIREFIGGGIYDVN